MKLINIFKTVILMGLVSLGISGTGASVGTDSGTQLLLPTGAKGLALSGANSATVSGADAIFYNPAGIINHGDGVETQFSQYNYIADINLGYAAIVSDMMGGTVGLSFKTLDFGDIKWTTADDTHGESGKTFSPNFSVLTVSYAKAFTDRVSFGTNLKMINESVDRTGGSAFALDMGVQYKHSTLPLHLGITLKNLGTKLQYSGSNLEEYVNSEPRAIISQASNLPAQLDLALTYNINNINIYGSFTNNSYGFNEFKFGGEFNLSLSGIDIWAGGGINVYSVDDDTKGWDEGITKNNFGPSFGGGFSVPIGSLNLGVDYGMRFSDTFANTGVLAFNIGF
ncbi:hypothetical protein EB821_00785 [Candidatus Marinimicrobia bacterium PRS2]|nr:hypothetical protein EB821_00785 [Candidatus Marinimicrobia bacterium PRS2]